ncbi:MAG TPA: site-specific integrase [Planctomycetota bacterium]|nr:site-specific integrase [Planctomycetota bacterium]
MAQLPKSFVMVLSRRYRVYFNPQGDGWYMAYHDGRSRQRESLGARTRPEAEAAVRKFDGAGSAVVQAAVLYKWPEVQKLFLDFKTSSDKAPATIARYKSSLSAFGRYLESKKIAYVRDVTLSILEGYRAYRVKTEKCDVKTSYNDELVIKGLFKWGSKTSRGIVAVNPALDWETPEPVKPKRRCYTAEEVAKLEVGVREWLRPIVITLAWSGMRIDELIHLRWADIDLCKRVLHVRVQEEWKPKGRRDRVIPLHPKVEAAIRQQAVGEYVFRGPNGGQIKETFALRCLKEDQRKLDLAEGDLHGLRRFFATSMLRAGVDTETVRQWGGWKSLDTMLRYLADVSVEESVQAMDAAAQRLAAS